MATATRTLDLNLTITLPPRNPYAPGDQPQYLDQSGPDCQGLDDIDGLIAAAEQGEFYCPSPPADGVRSTDNPSTGNPVCLGGSGPDDIPAGAGDPNPRAGTSLPSGLAGSTAELDFVRSILALPDRRTSRTRSRTWAPRSWHRC